MAPPEVINKRPLPVPYIKVVERKLGREKAWGLAYCGSNTIEIDSRLRKTPKRRLAVLCHEISHIIWPSASEEEIERAGEMLGRTLWREKYRRVEE